MSLSFKIDFNIAKKSAAMQKHIKNDLQPVLDVQVLKDSNYYCPFAEGTLQASGVKATVPGSGLVTWDEDYAKENYYATDRKFSLKENPNARAKWFEEAKAKQLKEWEKIVNENN